MEQNNQSATSYTYVIIGAGPAGMQLGYQLQRAGQNYVIVEKGTSPGEFFKVYPRHRMLISINKVNPGMLGDDEKLKYDWNSILAPDFPKFTSYTQDYFPQADVFLKYIADFQEEKKLNILFNKEITTIKKDGATKGYVLTDKDNNTLTCNYLVVATGWNTENVPKSAMCDGVQTYGNHSLDRELYRNKTVLILGKGNSALETAEHLIPTASKIHVMSPTPATFAWNSRYVGHIRAVNNNFFDTYRLKSGNNHLNARVEEIKKVGDKFQLYGSIADQKIKVTHILPYDNVITCTGFAFDTTIFEESIRPDLCKKKKFPLQGPNWESLKSENLYFAGTITHLLDVYKSASGFIHGFRYNVEVLGHYLLYKNHGIPLPQKHCANTEEVGKHALFRSNHCSGMFLQQNFICDVIVPNEDGSFTYYEGSTTHLATQDVFKSNPHYYVLTLSFGECLPDTWAGQRLFFQNRAYLSDASHPILRRYKFNEMVGEFHIMETLDSHWHPQDATYIQQHLEFFMSVKAENIDRIRDVNEFEVSMPLEAAWFKFTRKYKYKCAAFNKTYYLIEQPQAEDKATVLVGKLPGDPNNHDWDLRVTNLCSRTRTYVIDIIPVDMKETFDKIRHTFMFKAAGDEKCTINWTTEYVSDLKGDIIPETLKKKAQFIQMFQAKKGKMSYQEAKSKEAPSEFVNIVASLREKLVAALPNHNFPVGEMARMYFYNYAEAADASMKLKGVGIPTQPIGYWGGAYLIILPPAIQAAKDDLDSFAQKVASVF